MIALLAAATLAVALVAVEFFSLPGWAAAPEGLAALDRFPAGG